MRVQFFAHSALKATVEGRVIKGMALPYGRPGATPAHPPFAPGVLVDYGHPRPLLVDHDFRNHAGTVLKVWEGAEGIEFLAELSEPVAQFAGVSVGGEYLEENGRVVALYIHEISLTNAPAYQTSYKIVANSINMHTLKAQEEAILQELAALAEKITALEQRVTALEEAMQAMQAQAQAQREAAESAQVAANQALDLARTQLQGMQAQLAEWLEPQLVRLLDTVQKAIQNLQNYAKA